MNYMFLSWVDCMALREVKPMDDKQWKQVTGQLKAGPTKKSIKTVKGALELANKLKEA